MTARTLMIQGTASSVGKSLLVAGLCRLYARRGLRVLPFKSQNLSNNAGVTPEGGEIGRAQINQAEACGVAPHVDMNPVLLKPEADNRCQVVLLGTLWATVPAGTFYRHKRELWPHVTAALGRLRAAADLVIIEGAGSPAELNLREGDIVNMPVARHAQSPVLLVGDIDKGGIFAQLLGTLWLLQAKERELVRGLIVNKFRGDPYLFAEGVHILETRAGLPVMGVVPWLDGHGVAEEDAVALERQPAGKRGERSENVGSLALDIAVIAFPRIANFDDLDPLGMEPDVRVRFVRDPAQLGWPDAVILPGTKHTLADLAWFRQTGLAAGVSALAATGKAVVGICGGYQMLGRVISDPLGVEGGGSAEGLGLLAMDVTFQGAKATWQARARLCRELPWPGLDPVDELSGYEIHMGQAAAESPLMEIRRSNGETISDGAHSPDGRIWGTHLHGLFDNDAFRRAWLSSLGWHPAPQLLVLTARRAAAYDRLADALEAAMDLARLDAIIGL